jgi:hypothetical protein
MSIYLALYFIFNSFFCGHFLATETDGWDALDKLFIYFVILWFAALLFSVYYLLMIVVFIFKSLKKIFYDQEI